MTGFEFTPAKRENVSLLIGLAGGTGSGKTYSAMMLAKGLAGGKRFAVIDTEAGRAKHYADEFDFDHGDLNPPFRPEAYADAIKAADAAGYPVIVVDSTSHEHAGEGGLLDWHEELLDKMAGGDYKRREALTFAAWVKPKTAHKQFVSRLLQVRAHLILCFRAEEKIEIVKEGGKTVVKPKTTKTGLDGWVPVSEKNLPYELTLSFLLTANAPGVPRPIKLQAQHRTFFPDGSPITVEMGAALGAWASGGVPRSEVKAAPPVEPAPQPVDDISFEDDSDGMTAAEFAARVQEVEIPKARISEAGKKLFPGRSAATLTNAERGQLWDEIAPKPESERSSFADMIPAGARGE